MTNKTESDNALEFVRQAAEDSTVAKYALSEIGSLFQKYSSMEYDSFRADATNLLTSLGYGTDIETLAEVINSAVDRDLSWWAGEYSLYDSEGACYRLQVSRDGAQLLLPPSLVDLSKFNSYDAFSKLAKLDNAVYQNSVLLLSNDQAKVSLQFSLPYSTDDYLKPDAHVTDLTANTQVRCQGEVIVGSGTTARTLVLEGKRGSQTLKGVKHLADGDPVSAWAGQYLAFEVRADGSMIQMPDMLEITDGLDGLEFSWGDSILGDNVSFSNNIFSCNDDLDPTILYAGKFSAEQDGRKKLTLAKAKSGGIGTEAESHYLCFWQLPPQLQPALRPKARLFAMAAAMTTLEPQKLVNEQTFEININSFNAGTQEDQKWNTVATLPIGVALNNYNVTIKATRSSGHALTKCSWSPSATPSADKATSRVSLTQVLNDETGATQTFTISGLTATDAGTTLTVGVKLSVTDMSQVTDYYLTFKIQVNSLPAITVSPTTIPSVTAGSSINMQFKANGGQGGPYIWKMDTSTLPATVIFDPITATLKGSFDVSTAAAVYSVSLTVYDGGAAKVLMNPMSTVLTFTIQPQVFSNQPQTTYVNMIVNSASSSLALLILLATNIDKVVDYIKNKAKDPDNKSKLSELERLREVAAGMSSAFKEMKDSGKLMSIVNSALSADIAYLGKTGKWEEGDRSAVEALQTAVDKARVFQETYADVSDHYEKHLEELVNSHSDFKNDAPLPADIHLPSEVGATTWGELDDWRTKYESRFLKQKNVFRDYFAEAAKQIRLRYATTAEQRRIAKVAEQSDRWRRAYEQ